MESIKKDYQLSSEIESCEILPKISEETRELVKSAELLSKKRKRNHTVSIQKERG